MLSYLNNRKKFASFGITVLIPFFLVFFGHTEINAKAKSTASTIVMPEAVETEIKLDDINIGEKYLFDKVGKASHYAKRFHKRKTASGEKFNMYDFTAAHKSLPFGTILKVTNTSNDQSTLVRINDRGPYVRSRILDLSLKSAKSIDGLGVPMVKISGFIPGNSRPDYEEGVYYYSYSLDEEPMCLPNFALHMVDSSMDFQDAVISYKSMFPDFSGSKKLFLLVRSNSYDSNAVEKYYIGYFDGKRKAAQGIVAEKQ